jgi:hypothetical protein
MNGRHGEKCDIFQMYVAPRSKEEDYLFGADSSSE